MKLSQYIVFFTWFFIHNK